MYYSAVVMLYCVVLLPSCSRHYNNFVTKFGVNDVINVDCGSHPSSTSFANIGLHYKHILLAVRETLLYTNYR
jgi:hypothetical protein